jgi:serine/threonine/tyrosine-interacting protein
METDTHEDYVWLTPDLVDIPGNIDTGEIWSTSDPVDIPADLSPDLPLGQHELPTEMPTLDINWSLYIFSTMHKIDTNLWLGPATMSQSFLRDNEITHVFSILPPVLKYVSFPYRFSEYPFAGITVFDWPDHARYVSFVEDDPEADIMTTIIVFIPLIKNIIANGGNVYVHCIAGISRSASVVIAYIMNKYKCSFAFGLKLVASRRECINPNMGFCQQLQENQETIWSL